MIVCTEHGLFPVDAVHAELKHLANLASVVLNEHVNHDGLCTVCGCAFPCQPAVLAAHNVALL
ncbi:MAG: hypothetical protein DLM59_15175 [Pseudonocardiales bacterium]|nr:MAG: hypothetical protein DLM59_15175 [Pseudonocardiales bacterium]